jgi:hypothetical protein
MSAIEQTTTQKSSAGKVVAIVGCGCLGLVLLVLAGVGVAAFFGAKAFKNNAPYLDSIAVVESNAAALEALGSPISPGFIPSGSISTENGQGSVDFTIPVSGPKGKGSIRVVGSKAPGSSSWSYETWELQVADGETIPLGQ